MLLSPAKLNEISYQVDIPDNKHYFKLLLAKNDKQR